MQVSVVLLGVIKYKLLACPNKVPLPGMWLPPLVLNRGFCKKKAKTTAEGM